MTHERIEELLTKVIDHMVENDGLQNAIAKLLTLGFIPEELYDLGYFFAVPSVVEGEEQEPKIDTIRAFNCWLEHNILSSAKMLNETEHELKVGDIVYAETVFNGQKLCRYGEIVRIDKETAYVKDLRLASCDLWGFNLSDLSKEVKE